MSVPERPADVAAGWMRYADVDMQFAWFGVGRAELQDMAAFHAQQAIEKALKAMCVAKRIGFDKTHDLARLLGNVRAFAPEFAEEWRHVDQITEYAVTSRYPVEVGGRAVEPPAAVALAEQFLKAVQRWFAEQPEV